MNCLLAPILNNLLSSKENIVYFSFARPSNAIPDPLREPGGGCTPGGLSRPTKTLLQTHTGQVHKRVK